MTIEADVFIVGGGPAGLAAAIASRQKGLRVTVAERQRPPIDKACGEGLMSGAVTALQALGVRLPPNEVIPFRGIRFLDGQTGASTEALFSAGVGLAVRRVLLHARLTERAVEIGVTMVWGAQVTFDDARIACNGHEVRSRWIVAADGQRSEVRKSAGLDPRRQRRGRFGFRQHFKIAPWTDFVEVYWGPSCQVAVTPTSSREIGLAVVTGNPRTRVRDALHEMPILAARLGEACATSRERGAPCLLRRLPTLHLGRVVLIGDASGSVDPVTGEGLGLAFRQAIALSEALQTNRLDDYATAHRRIARLPHRMSRWILAMDRHPWLRKRALRVLAAEPRLFGWLIDASAQRQDLFPPLATVGALHTRGRIARPERLT